MNFTKKKNSILVGIGKIYHIQNVNLVSIFHLLVGPKIILSNYLLTKLDLSTISFSYLTLISLFLFNAKSAIGPYYQMNGVISNAVST